MYCIFLSLIHKFVNFYEKAIFMGKLSVGEVRSRIFYLFFCMTNGKIKGAKKGAMISYLANNLTRTRRFSM